MVILIHALQPHGHNSSRMPPLCQRGSPVHGTVGFYMRARMKDGANVAEKTKKISRVKVPLVADPYPGLGDYS